MIKTWRFRNAVKTMLLMLVVINGAHFTRAEARSAVTDKQGAAELAADRMIKDESITQRPKPYTNSAEVDKDFSDVMNHLSSINRKLVVRENVGSPTYRQNVDKFRESNAANVKRIREVFAPAGLGENVQIYVVKREMFHIYMIEEEGNFKILTILNRQRG